MKKIAPILLLIIFSPRLHAQQKSVLQSPPARNKWFGILAGPNLNYLNYTDGATTIGGNNPGLHAGVFLQKDIKKHFAVQPTLLLTLRGGKIRNVDSTTDARLMNIELPVNFLYLHTRLIIGGGPNFSYGVNGKLKTNASKRNAYKAEESFERTLKRFEFGANFLVGYAFKKGFVITANFSPGFTNMYKGDGSAPSNVKAHTQMVGVSFGYMFRVINNK